MENLAPRCGDCERALPSYYNDGSICPACEYDREQDATHYCDDDCRSNGCEQYRKVR